MKLYEIKRNYQRYKNQFISSIKKNVKNWCVPLLIGIILIFNSIWTFASLVESYLALAIVFSIVFVLAGFLETFSFMVNRESIKGWWRDLAFCIMTLIVGVFIGKSRGIYANTFNLCRVCAFVPLHSIHRVGIALLDSLIAIKPVLWFKKEKWKLI